MAAVSIAEQASGVVVFGEKESSEGAVGRVFAEELIHRTQEMVGLLLGDGAEAAQIGLQVGHQERGGDSFAGDVGDDEAEAALAEVEEVVIVAADLASLNADARVFESGERRQGLREQTRLHVLGDFEFVRGAAFGFLLATMVRRCASMAWVSSSKLTSEKELPSISR